MFHCIVTALTTWSDTNLIRETISRGRRTCTKSLVLLTFHLLVSVPLFTIRHLDFKKNLKRLILLYNALGTIQRLRALKSPVAITRDPQTMSRWPSFGNSVFSTNFDDYLNAIFWRKTVQYFCSTQ